MDYNCSKPTITTINTNSLTGWESSHNAACLHPREGLERAVIDMLSGWIRYGHVYNSFYERTIVNEGNLGKHWAKMGISLRRVLKAYLGPRLDGETLELQLNNALAAQGFDPDKR